MASKEQTTERMRERHQRIHALAAAGLTKNAIAARLGLNRKTVYKYLALPAPPERRHVTRQRSALAPYEGYVLRRWKEGCRNARALWRELRDQGYNGAYQNVERIMAYLRRQHRLRQPLPEVPAGLTPRQAVGLVLMRDDARSGAERATVLQVKGLAPEIRQVITLLEGFIAMLRQCPHDRPRDRLESWMAEVDEAGVPELRTFVAKLRQDEAAVVSGLRLPWSQGQTEGQINKLKTIKRAMYGRAGFDLLKQRVLYMEAA
jgi:transposase